MPAKQIIFLSIVFMGALVLVMHMIINHRLKEVYAVMWVLAVLSIPCVIFLYPLLGSVSDWIGLQSPLEFAFFMAIAVLYALSLHFSTMSSGLQRNMKNAIQKIALLENSIEVLQRKMEENNVQPLEYNDRTDRAQGDER